MTSVRKNWNQMRVEEKLEFLKGELAKMHDFAIHTDDRVDDFSAKKRPNLKAMEQELDQLLQRFDALEDRISKLERRSQNEQTPKPKT